MEHRDVKLFAREVEFFAKNMLKTWYLWGKGWRFEWDRAKTRAGACKFHKKRITLSRPIFEGSGCDMAEARETVLHEIAHAIAGFEAGHGRTWKMAAQMVGARPERTTDRVKPAPAKYALRCPSCGKVCQNRHRKTSKVYACGSCCRKHNRGRYSDRYKLNWELRG